ncbi:MAG: protein rep, partial [Trichodesmium sp. MAG_R04]|nr:protein rep [Trichodesmium sp. MAG_R04]
MKSLDEYPISKYFGEYFLSEIGNSTDYKFSKYYQYSRKTSEMFIEGFRYLQYQDLLHWSYRIKNCASNLWFTFINDEMKLKRANFCRVRYCPMCSYRRAKINRARLFQVWSKISHKYRFLFLTLTVKNVPLNIFRDVYQKQFRFGFLRFRKNLFYNNSSIKGFIRATEITQPKDSNYTHPHIHMLIAVDEDYFESHNYMDVSYWGKMWKEALRLDYDPITYISAVSEDGGKSLLEVTKYELKPVN